LPNPPSSHVLSREKLHVSLHMQPIGCLGGGGLGGGGGGHGGSDGGFGGDGGEGGGGGRGYTNVCPLQLGGCSVSNSGQAYRQRPIRTARALLNQRRQARKVRSGFGLCAQTTLWKKRTTRRSCQTMCPPGASPGVTPFRSSRFSQHFVKTFSCIFNAASRGSPLLAAATL